MSKFIGFYMDGFIGCPKCGNTEFEEVALCWTRQKGVRVNAHKGIDYEKADTVTLEDNPPVKKYLKCPKCDSELRTVTRRLKGKGKVTGLVKLGRLR